jgi:hypothetical protein
MKLIVKIVKAIGLVAGLLAFFLPLGWLLKIPIIVGFVVELLRLFGG